MRPKYQDFLYTNPCTGNMQIEEITGYSKDIIRFLGGYEIQGYSLADAAVDIVLMGFKKCSLIKLRDDWIIIQMHL
mgnify:CR=1 FL=1